ncbi:DEAD/DEAH box helicase [Thalassotalea sp. G20_0]|nr:DEAD/DEAH box helicase [Thalassotalea sp. G20_0]
MKKGFEQHSRGKMIMACGTGKTFTALRLMEEVTPETGRILFLAPSISLVSQSLREWTAQGVSPINAFVVCSDSKVGKDEEDISLHDLAYPATTDAKKLAAAAKVVSKDRRTIVFSTYQSIQVVSDAQKQGLGDFDLIICDEAHRTTGLTLQGQDYSEFVKVHQNHIVKADKRVYMTATPRIYADKSKNKANEADAVLFSMDDEDLYGPELYRLGFGKAVEKDLLTEYKVLIVAVEEDKMANLVNNYNAFKVADDKAIDMKLATKIIGSWKGLSKQGLVMVDEAGEQEDLTEDTAPMRRAVAFSRSIKDSKQTTDIFAKLVETYQNSYRNVDTSMVNCELDHVDGSMNAHMRQEKLSWLKDDISEGDCRILSNARCLSEGIDVPSLDSVIFFDTRESIVDIVQSVGRVMRKDPAGKKQYGYIILPVCMPSERVKDYNSFIDSDPQFKSIWKVIKALRAHDESLVDEAEFRKKIQVIVGEKGGGSDDDDGSGGTLDLPLDIPNLPFDEVNEAVYAAIPKKLGDREYWSEWAKDIGKTAERLIARIKSLIKTDKTLASEFDTFLQGLKDTLNPAVTADEAIEMLAQHVLTLPVFQALFTGNEFPEQNVVAKALQKVVDRLDESAVASETDDLQKFYDNVRERISLAKSDKSKQDIIRNLYDTFFHNAFPRMAERLGIVYTPIEVVDFILNSVQATLSKHFGNKLGDKGIHIVDPFSGTGTFIVRLIQSGLISNDDLPHKFSQELHANEIVLLAYYIATVNIETAFHGQTGSYLPFDGMVLTDTFQMTEDDDLVDQVVLPENNARASNQLAQPITVIVGNPPYSAQQGSENDNNKNMAYPTLDDRIRNTYADRSNAKLVKNLYDSYIRAIRWASDRIGDRGIAAFVTNGSFLDANNMDGLRKCLVDDYSHLYIFNLRGNQRTSGEESRREGGKIFGSGSRTPVTISIMVKDPGHVGACELFYHDIGDYLSREEKLAIIEEFASVDGIEWQKITPNAEGDWINQRDPAFDRFMPLGDKEASSDVLFDIYSLGVTTNRDAWAYNMSRDGLESNMRRMIDAFNEDSSYYSELCKGKAKQDYPKIESIIELDPKHISWTHNLKMDAIRGKSYEFEKASVVQSIYRPYTKQWLYFNRRFNERVYQQPKLFPTPDHKNMIISASGIGANKPFSALASNLIPCLDCIEKGQAFPLYWYEKPQKEEQANPQSDMLSGGQSTNVDEHGYIRHDAISDWALDSFRDHYGDDTITKEDIFWYVYGILHSAEYRQRFAADLKKMLPRIPFAGDFRAFSDAGRKLGEWHLNYETVEPFPLDEHGGKNQSLLMIENDDYRVSKMVFGKKGKDKDKSVIVYNSKVILEGIPLEAYEYVVNGKPAIEWVMERYQVTVDKNSHIQNDPNQWSEDPRYIVDLVKRIVRVSVETVRIVKALPPLNETTV